jgi:ribosomal protein S18 acetylase RimI-like enzyme
MGLEFRNAQTADLPAIMAIERAGFTPNEAASTESMRERIELIPDSFIVATADEQVRGYIVGPAIAERYLYDELFDHLTANDATAAYLGVLSLAVAPDTQGQGIGGQLLTAFADRARVQGRRGITLTCLKRLVPFYEAHAYVNEGVADSAHAGETWYNLVRELG